VSVPTWRARIFMIDAELPFAGHPTIGTACYALGTLLEGDGARVGRLQIPAGTVEATFVDGVAKAAIPHNVHLHAEGAFSVEMLEALQPSLRGGGGVLRIDVMSPVRGMNFVCVELESLEVLGLVGCTGKRPTAELDAEWDVGFVGALFYVRTGEEDGKDGRKVVKVRSRMIEGVMEDPATGSAACALGALLSLRAKERRVVYEITQGVEMGRRSDIGMAVTLTEGLDEVETLELSGSSVKVMEGKVEYD
jgi:PhzF family phenazine biosynthesis protein